MAVVPNPDLDSISAFTNNGNGTVTATVSYTFTYAPTYVSGVANVYTAGSKVYITGAETAANNGTWVIVSSTTGSITYTNPTGVTQTNQFALCSPLDVSLVKGLTTPLTITAAKPFSYAFSSSTPWNPPPSYNLSLPLVNYSGAFPIIGTTTGTTTHLVTTITSTSVYVPPSPPFFPGFGTPPNVSSATVTYPAHDINNLYPYNFSPSIALSVVNGTLPNNGSNYLTFDGDGTQSRVYSKCNIFNVYKTNLPTGIVYDSVNGVLYVADTAQGVIRKIIVSTKVESIIAGGAVSLDGVLALDGFGTSAIINHPIGLALDETNQLLYVSELDTGSIRVINLVTLQVTTEWQGALDYSDQQKYWGLAVDPSTNTLYLAASTSSKLVSRDLTTHTDTDILSTAYSPYALALDTAANTLYHTDGYGNVNALVLGGSSSVLWTAGGSLGLAIDPVGGILYVSDYGTHTISQITLSPFSVSLVAGSGSPGNADGTGAAASFNEPNGIALDSATGNLYVADNLNNSIRRIDTGTTAVATDVLGTIPAGWNAITISGTTHLYNSAATIQCIPGSDALSYTLGYNGTPGLPVNALCLRDSFLPTTIQLIVNYTGLTSTPSITFNYYSPTPITSVYHLGTETPLIRNNGSTTDLTSLIGPPNTSVAFGSATGFTYVPTTAPMSLNLQLYSEGTGVVFENYTNNVTVTAIPILSSPTFATPFLTYTYVPLSYAFSLPVDVADVTLDFTSSSSSLTPYLSSYAGNTVVNFYTASGVVAPLSATLTIRAYISGVPISVGTLSTTVTVLLSSITADPPVPSGVPINLYKYEDFDYDFTLTGIGTPLTLRYTRSSAQLAPYCSTSSDLATVHFTGTPPASYASTFLLVIDLMSGTTIVNSLTYPVTISAGRIIVSPASPFILYQYENVSNTFGTAPTFSNPPRSSITFDRLFTTPALPTGLSFSTSNTLVGKPFLKQSRRNYEIYGSNTTTGDITTTTLAIQVDSPIVRITPAAVNFSGLTRASTPTATFTSILPETISYVGSNNFVYSWSTLPNGVYFTDISGTPLSSAYTFNPTDIPPSGSNTIKLAGTPTLSDIAVIPSNGVLVTTLTGSYSDATARATGSTSLTFNFAEAVGMTGTASSLLYVGKPLGSNDVVVTATSYFFTSGNGRIRNFVITAPPAGLSLASNSPTNPTRWWFTGTPTVASTSNYTFTATNSNSVVSSNVLSITINPDVVSFTYQPADPTFIVSRKLTDTEFHVAATATSGSPITYTSSVDFSLYGLTLNSTTGYLTGTPTSNFGPGPIVFTATDSLGAFATYTNTNFRINHDTFTWPTYAPTFVQNKAITPYQFIVTTTSGRSIQSFTSPALPAGLSLSLSGVLSGTLTGATSSTFIVTATTGYLPPPTTASLTVTYTAIADNLLIVQTNGTDPISGGLFSASFQTAQYSSGTAVNPTYSIGNLYPLQYPSQPVLAMSAGGTLSGDFTAISAPFPRYATDITASYAGVTTTTTAVMSLSNTPTPFILAGWALITSDTGSNYANLSSTNTYPFQVTTAGVRINAGYPWTYRALGSAFPATVPTYPDFGRNGTTFVAITPSNVYEATYNTTTNTLGTFTSTLAGTSLSPTGPFGCVASDSVSNWMVVVKSTRITTFTRAANSGSWGTQWTDANSNFTNASSQSTLQYIAPNYVYGQFGDSSLFYSNVLYSVEGKTWSTPATPPLFSNVRRFAVSNTTIVAVGSAKSTELGANAPISVSTDSGATWTTQAVDLPNLVGPNVIINDLVYGNGRWVLCGIGSNSSNIIASSLNLSNWTIFPANDNIWSSIAVNANGWTIGGTYSANGVSASNSPRSVTLAIDAAFSSSFTNSNGAFNYSSQPTASAVFTRMLSTPFSNTSSFPGSVTIPGGSLTFVQPVQTNYVLYQYVPYTIPIEATGLSGFLYYYTLGVPVGFQFELKTDERKASITGISPSNGVSTIALYVKTATSAPSALRIVFNTMIPFILNPMSGAGAYTALLRTEVDANAAQNARDTRTFPQVDPLAGPFMGPRAPDVITQSNCFLGLCKKPCPTCHTMM
uniref:Uncharacterized protein n=1 Tax=viral metagenome TaxID=1070528 RepID=A0A6C0F1N7_9ZZZZ